MNFERHTDPKASLQVGVKRNAIRVTSMIEVSFDKNGNRRSTRIKRWRLHEFLQGLSECKYEFNHSDVEYDALVHEVGGQIQHTVPILFVGTTIVYRESYYMVPGYSDPRWGFTKQKLRNYLGSAWKSFVDNPDMFNP